MRPHKCSSLPLPPFGREVIQHRSYGPVNLFVFAGEGAWQRARRRPIGQRAAVPPNEPWSRFDWTFVNGLGVTLIAHGMAENELCDFGAHLIRRGATLVAGLLVVEDRKLPTVNSYFFKPETPAGERNGR